MTSLDLRAAAITDVGCKRKNNEDSILSLPEHGVFCVADGMGGAREGQVASKALTDELSKAFAGIGAGSLDLSAKVRLVRETVNQVNLWIKKRIEERGFAQMGSTVVVGIFDGRTPSQGIVVHAGDSRMYRYRDRTLKQLTVDHSFVTELGAKNEKALPAEFRGVVTKAVGLREELVLEETSFDIQSGDILFFCSDGLTRMLSDKFMQKLLRQSETLSPDALARLLVGEANQAGGEDNISVIVLKAWQGGAVDNKVPGAETIPSKEGNEPETASTATITSPSSSSPLEQVVSPLPVNAIGNMQSENDSGECYTPNTSEGHTPHSTDRNSKATDESAVVASLHRAKPQRLFGVDLKMAGGVIVLAILLIGFMARQSLRGDKDGLKPNNAMATDVYPAPGNGGGTNIPEPFPSTGDISPAPTEVVEVVELTPTQPIVEQSPPPIATPVIASVALAPPNAADDQVPPADAILMDTTTAVAGASIVADLNISPKDSPMVTTEAVDVALASSANDAEPPTLLSTPVPSEGVAVAGESTGEYVSAALPLPELPPTVMATKSKEDEEKSALKKAKSIWASKVDSLAESGEWGGLQTELNLWWDKLDQVEPDSTERGRVQSWVMLWNEVSTNSESRVKDMEELQKIARMMNLALPPLGLVEGDMEERANSLCKSYYNRQSLLLKGAESFSSNQEQQVSSLEKILSSGLTNLYLFLNDPTPVDCKEISDSLMQVGELAKGIKEWAKKNRIADIPVGPDQYPGDDINNIKSKDDAAWDKLLDLITPLGEEISFKRRIADPKTAAKLVEINDLYGTVMKNRLDFSSLRDLLIRISNFMKAQTSQVDSSN